MGDGPDRRRSALQVVGPGATALLLAAALPSHGAAQTPTVPQEDTVRVEGVEVEVLRRTLATGQVPFSISVVTEEEIHRGTSGVSLEEALRGVPGVQVQNRFNYAVGERISIRGFGARSQFGVRGLRILVDGIPATVADGQSTLDHLDIPSLGRVEALRGPSSSLYGNASGGVLAFRTMAPPATPFRQEVGATTGSDGLVRLSSSTSGRVGETGYLLSLGQLSYDGYRTNPVAGEGYYGSAERRTLNGQVTHPVAGGHLRLTVNAVDLEAQNPGSLARDPFDGGSTDAFAGNVNQGTRKTVRQEQAGLGWSGPLGETVDAEFVGYGIRRYVDNPIPGQIVDLNRWAGGGRAVVRWDQPAGEAGPRLWMAGAELDFQRDDRLNFRNVQGQRGDRTLDQEERVSGVGVFAQSMIPLTPRVWSVAGVRYDRINFRADDRFPREGGADFSGDRLLDAVSPTVGLHLELGGGAGVFANLATSFESPTTTELANRPDGAGGFNPELDPQRGLTGEVGGRAILPGGVRGELSGFLTRVSGELIPFEDAAEPGRVFFRNAGSSRYLGLETVLETAPAPLRARLTWSWTDATFQDYVVRGQDFSGNRVPGQAAHQVEALLTAAVAGWSAELRGNRLGAVPVDDANQNEAPAYTLLDLRLGSSPLLLNGFRVTPTLGLTNLTDQRYATSVAVNAFGGRFYEPGPGRSFHAGVTVGWEVR